MWLSGLDIWCIEDLRLVPVTRSSYGKFYSGSAYVELNQTTLHKSGSFHYEILYWLGTDANIEINRMTENFI
ncbi:hypothetical protein MLD38_011531 [Melastoma candidum]|uniref:Uncharacterized protein n=1 Tax=Melastoma candidum TaxID=119954 RepID=A0ACB9R4H7_9MYRT|nr:hypothetical protein MLD38_011531 [Melastoma candidum]